MDCIASHDSTAQQQQELVRKANDEYAEKLKALQGVFSMLEGRCFFFTYINHSLYSS